MTSHQRRLVFYMPGRWTGKVNGERERCNTRAMETVGDKVSASPLTRALCMPHADNVQLTNFERICFVDSAIYAEESGCEVTSLCHGNLLGGDVASSRLRHHCRC